MNHPNKRSIISKKLLICISLVLFLFNCKFSRIFHKDQNNYFSSSFQCHSGIGWREQSQYQRYLGFWTLVRNEYQIDNRKIGNAKIVITGNSLVHLFTPNLIEREFPKKGVINRGIGGDMTETLLIRIEEDVLVLEPQVVIIEIGGNDLIQGKCLSEIQNNAIAIIEKIRNKNSRTKIVFISIPPTDVPNLNAIVPVYNSFLASLPSRFPNLIYIDTWQDMRDPDRPTIREDFVRREIGDRIHFNENGYSVWGRLIRPHI
jgi:lysophospholipase L1-like esterase